MSLRRGNKFPTYQTADDVCSLFPKNSQCYRRQIIKLKVVRTKGTHNKPVHWMSSIPEFHFCLKDYVSFS